MPRHPNTRRAFPPCTPLVLALALFAAPHGAVAQGQAVQAAAAMASTETSIGAGLDLTISSLQARVKKLEAGSTEAGDSTAEALRSYQSAIDQLELAAEWRQRADGLARIQREGPKLLDSTRRDADAWSHQAPTPVDADAGRSEVEAMLAETEARLAVVRKGLLDLDAEQAQLAERRLALPAELATAGAARESLLGELDLPPLPTGSVETTLARRAAALATQKAALEQAQALELELSTYEARRELLSARRELMRRKADAWAASVSLLQEALAGLRAREAEQDAAEARADQASLARVHPVLGDLAEENARLMAGRAGTEGLTAKLDAATRRLSDVAAQLQQVEERSKSVRQKVAAAGLTDAVGLLLRKERGELADIGRARADIRARRDEISAVQLQALNLEDMQKALPALEAEVEGILKQSASTVPDDERARIESSARNVLKSRRSSLEALTRETNAYFTALVDLDAKEAELVRVLTDYRLFLDQHVLWVPNAALRGFLEVGEWRDAALWILAPGNYAALGGRLGGGLRSVPVRAALGFMLLAALVAYRGRLRRLHARLCETRRVEEAPQVPAPAAVLVVGILLALPGPFAARLVALLLEWAPGAPDDFSHAFTSALAGLWFPLLVAEFLRRATAKDGPAAVFLEWPRSALDLLRRQVILAETVAMPAFFLTALLDAQPADNWGETLGRAAFCFGVAVTALAMHRVLAPQGTIVQHALRRTDLGWWRTVLQRVGLLPVVGAAFIVAIAAGGYYYSAFVLVERLWWSGLVILVFLVATASVLRWLAGQAALHAVQDGGAEAAPGSVPRGGLELVSARTRSLLRVVFGLVLVLGLFTVWVDVFPALRFFEQVELWRVASTVEKTVGTGDAAHVEAVAVTVPVTVANLLLAMVGAAFALLGARNLPALLELTLLSRLRLDHGLRYAIATVTRYLAFVVGSVTVLTNLGVEWANVQWLVAAVSVGLGFGLQEIFGNFVSGLIVLFERPVRVGDTVTIDGITGTVARIEMRATTVVDADLKELVVPNKNLITGKLVNWTRHDPTTRIVLPVSVAYGSDTAAVARILQEAAKQSATVLENPAPLVALTRFGDSALEYELRVFVTHPDAAGPTRHELLLSVERKLRAAGIEMPFPQRDVHLRSVDAAAAASLGGTSAANHEAS